MRLASTLAFAFVLVSCGKPHGKDVAPVANFGPVETLRRVCVTPPSQHEMLAAAKALHWRELEASRLPPEMVTTGMVEWSGAWQTTVEGRPFYLAIGSLSGTSHCALRFTDADPGAVREQLSLLEVLGKPLGAPDDERALDGASGWASQQLVGWHLSREKSWRTVHFLFGGKGEGADPPPRQGLEVTRPV